MERLFTVKVSRLIPIISKMGSNKNMIGGAHLVQPMLTFRFLIDLIARDRPYAHA